MKLQADQSRLRDEYRGPNIKVDLRLILSWVRCRLVELGSLDDVDPVLSSATSGKDGCQRNLPDSHDQPQTDSTTW